MLVAAVLALLQPAEVQAVLFPQQAEALEQAEVLGWVPEPGWVRVFAAAFAAFAF